MPRKTQDKRIDLEVPLIPEFLGVEELSPDLCARIESKLNPENQTTETVADFQNIVKALIDIHRRMYFDRRKFQRRFEGMTVENIKNESLVCKNVPIDTLLPDGETLTAAQLEFISTAVRDILLAPKFPKTSTSREVSAQVKAFMENTGFFNREVREASVVWGGGSLPKEEIGRWTEYTFAKSVGYWDALLRKPEIITGCGSGMMKAPFSGASVAFEKQRLYERKNSFGFSEKKILTIETPNSYITRLLIFKNMMQRIEGFIRAGHRLRVHPGGAGTLEEITTFLAMIMHKANDGLHYPFHLVERTGGEWVKTIQEYLCTCFGNTLEDKCEFFVGEPEDYGRMLNKLSIKPESLWNDDLFFPTELQKSPEVSFESIESLDFSTDQDMFQLLINIQRLFSSLVHLLVKDPALAKSWGDEKPLIKGTPKIVRATDDLIKWFTVNNRMYMPPDQVDKLPYRVE